MQMPPAQEIFGPDKEPSGNGRKVSQATAIVQLATEAGCELFHTPSGDCYIAIKANGHSEHHAVNSRGCRDYLNRILYLETNNTANTTAMQAAIATLSGIARFDGEEHDVHLRVAGDDDRFYLDLGDPQWQVVEMTRAGWQVVAHPPVRFRRTRGMHPLPIPVAGGSVRELRPYVNVSSDADYALIVSALVQMFRPRGPYPVLVLNGEQGTAKTTTGRVLRRLVDPNQSDVRSEPREARDLAVAADNGHVIAFDNLSRLPEWLSDALCRLATGGGFSTRTLYENREEEIFEATRPVIVNGIAQVATRPDLIDRAVVVTLPVIQDASRRDESEFWASFEAARPCILGALLDAVVTALRNRPKVKLAEKPRMADFALWAVAAEPALPWSAGTFMSAYTENRMGAVEATLDGDPVAEVIQKIMPWDGTASELLATLNAKVPENITRRRDWFSKPRQVSDALRRLAPALRRTGIEVTFTKHGHSRTRVIEISPIDSSASSASSAGPDLRADPADADADDADAGVDSSAGSSAQNPNVYSGADAADAADAAEPLLFDEGNGADDYYGA